MKGLINLKLDRPFDAIIDFSSAINNNPGNPKYHNYLAQS